MYILAQISGLSGTKQKDPQTQMNDNVSNSYYYHNRKPLRIYSVWIIFFFFQNTNNGIYTFKVCSKPGITELNKAKNEMQNSLYHQLAIT